MNILRITKTIIYLILLIVLNSCYTSADYALLKKSETKSNAVYGKILVLKNNNPTQDVVFNKMITDDFTNLFGQNLTQKLKNDYFDNFKFLPIINKELLEKIKIDNPDLDYMMFIRFMTTDSDISKPKTLQIIDYKDIKYIREYHILFDLYNLNTKENIYSNEAVSILEKLDASGITPSELSQLKQTYKKIFKDFATSISQ